MKTLTKAISILLVSIIFLTACSSSKSVNATADNELVIYAIEGEPEEYDGYGYAGIDYYIAQFKEAHKDINVVKRSFATSKEMEEVLQTELLAKKGPDVIIFDYFNRINTNSLAKSGSLLSLDKKIDADKTLKKENYLPGTFEAGKVDGELYLLPLTFSIPTLEYAYNSDLKIEPSSVIEFSKLGEAIDFSMEKHASNSNRLSIGTNMINVTAPVMSGMVAAREYTPEEIAQVSEFIKKIYDDFPKQETFAQKYATDFTQLYSKSDYMLMCDVDLIHQSGWYTKGVVDSIGIKDFTLSAVTTMDNKDVNAFASMYAAVTKDSHELSYDFLRIAMDSNPTTTASTTYGMPLNKENLKMKMDSYEFLSTSVAVGDGRINIKGMDEKTTDNLTEIIDSITNVVIIDGSFVWSIYWNSFTPYFQGEKSYDECYEEFDNKLKIYRTE